MRIGEATVPGPSHEDFDSFLDSPLWVLPEVPEFCLGVANPSGISNKHHVLPHMPVGLWHLTETQASYVQQCQLRQHLKWISNSQGRNIRSVMGAPAALRAGSSFAGSWTGVLSFGDCPLRGVPHVWPSSEYSSGRAMLSVAHVGDVVLTLATVYCPPKGPTFPRAKALTEELLTPITEALVLGRSGPRAVLGDFNCQAGTLDQTKIWESKGWVELQDLMLQIHGIAPQPTCKSATAPDQIWMSPEMCLLVHNMAVWDIFPDHSVLVAGIRVPSGPRLQMQWRLPGHIPWDEIDKNAWTSAPDLGSICGTDSQHAGSGGSVVPADTTEAFRSWCNKFEHLVSASCGSRTVRADKSFFGRGVLDRPRPRQACVTVPKHSRAGEVSQISGFLNRSVSRWFKQLRRLQSYMHAIKSSRASDTFLSRASLWRSILVADGFQSGFQQWWIVRPHPCQGSPQALPDYPPNQQLAQLIYDDFFQHYRRFEHWQFSKRQESCRAKLLATSKGLFTITRKPAKDNLDCLEDRESQVITVIDGSSGLVEVETPFQAGHAIHWTLQDQPAIVSPSSTSDNQYFVDSDLLLVDGQSLVCTTLVHEEAIIQQRLSDLWSPRWLRHVDTPSSTWDEICTFAEHHIPRKEFEFPVLTVADWRRAVRSFKPNAATGPCGWTRLDLLNMTDGQISHLLDFFRDLELGAPWPRQLQVGLVHLLQKKESSTQANGFRPINVMSLLYRVYAGLRAGQLLHHIASLSAFLQCGFLRGRQAADVWFFVGVCVEVSIQQGTAVHGLVADLVKAYNTLPRFPTFRFLGLMGVPNWFLQMWQNHLAGFTRFFVVRRSVGSAQKAVTGFPEGCPLSCCAMAAVDLVWHLFQSDSVPRCLPISFVDNLEIICDRVEDLLLSSTALSSFCGCMDLELDVTCFIAWSTSPTGRRELKNQGFNISLGQRDLGGQVMYCKQLRNKVLQDRIAEVHPFFSKLRASPLPFAAKSANIRLVLWPRALHGCESAILGEQHIQKLRSGAMKALRWDRAGATPLVRLCLLHLNLDPGWYQLWRVAKTFQTQIIANSVVADWWKHFCQGLQSDTSHGPFGKIISLLRDIGLTIDADFRLWFSERGFLSLLHCAEGSLHDVLARAYQSHICARVRQRKGYEGLDGCDFELTTSNDHVFSAAEVEQLMIVRDGSFFTDQTKSKWDTQVTNQCAWCQTKDTKYHRYTACTKYDHLRSKYMQLFDEWDSLPTCFTHCGLVPNNPWQELVWEALAMLPDQTEDFQLRPPTKTLHVFTDGTCSNPATKSISLAAWAIVLAGHGTVASGPLVGIQQCIMRAELTAVVSALKWTLQHFGSLHLWCDNQVVVDHFRALQSKAADPTDFEHSELWKQAQELLESTSADVWIHKVYSHDLESESISPLQDFCRFWNGCADRQAEFSNLTRPRTFERIWDRFCGYRDVWIQRVKWYTHFVAEVAEFDCNNQREEDDDMCTEVAYPVFERFPNEAAFATALHALVDQPNLFFAVCSQFQQTVFHRFVRWISSIDLSSATKRCVSLFELYVGFRVLDGDGAPLASGGDVVDKYSPVTFAVDFSFFKQIIGHVFSVIDHAGPLQTITLLELQIKMPLPAIIVGWPVDVEKLVFDHIVGFVRNRPVVNVQGLSRPWHPK